MAGRARTSRQPSQSQLKSRCTRRGLHFLVTLSAGQVAEPEPRISYNCVASLAGVDRAAVVALGWRSGDTTPTNRTLLPLWPQHGMAQRI